MEDDLKGNIIFFCKLVEDYMLTPALPELGTAQPQLVFFFIPFYSPVFP
jgi:hypothetical protein